MTHPQQTTREVLEQLVYALDELRKNPALKYENTFIESALTAGRAALAHNTPSTTGERAEVIENLLMYAGDNGYSHIDYADTMRHAAALLQSTAMPAKDQL